MKPKKIRIETADRGRKRFLLQRYRGLLTEVARRRGITPSVVSRIYWGSEKSAETTRVINEVLNERMARTPGQPNGKK